MIRPTSRCCYENQLRQGIDMKGKLSPRATASSGTAFRLTRRSQRPAVLILISRLQSQESVLALLPGSVRGDLRRTEGEVCGWRATLRHLGC